MNLQFSCYILTEILKIKRSKIFFKAFENRNFPSPTWKDLSFFINKLKINYFKFF